ASEVMAILCLSENISDLKARLGKIIVGRTYTGEIVTAKDLNAHGAMAALLKEALKPNLVQTLENTPAIIHGGPFANIAHGCNSILATKIALSHCDYVVTEAGFGADLGAEKFFNIKCRIAGFTPDCVVIVATARALKMHGGVHKSELKYENLEALAKGLENLEKHIENIERFKLPVVVAINRFHNDTEAELSMIKNFCDKKAIAFSLSEVWEKGGEGGLDLAQKVMDLANEHKRSDFRFLYDLDEPLSTKIEKIATEIYGADSVVYSKDALKKIDTINSEGFGNLPICMAKTQNSISDDPTLLGRPKGFRLHVRDLAVSAGAGFIVVYTGDIMTMPGLPKKPAAVDIDIDDDGKISGLF
ncbi:MAG TPA: formate--tetrahydrofolate ligase, partial [Spirochaetota bacterium]|nr:formate--tetrahydrofolate ligase [Spirochaetota bacterium]